MAQEPATEAVDPMGEFIHRLEGEDLPAEVNPEELSEKSKGIIREAYKNPEFSLQDVGDNTGWSNDTVRRVLVDHVPNWYQDVFKQTGSSSWSYFSDVPITETQEKEPEVSKEKILELIEKNDGLTLYELFREIPLSVEGCRKILNSLEDMGEIKKDGKEFIIIQEKPEEPEENSMSGLETKIESICEYESENGNALAEYVIEILNSDLDEKIVRIHSVCAYELNQKDNRLAEHIHDMIDSSNL